MKKLNLEALNMTKMFSGHFCLNLTEKISWEDFPDYAENLIDFLDGKILSKADGPDIRIWDVLINKRKYHLTFDDYPQMVALESTDDESDNYINKIRESLLQLGVDRY